MPGVRRLALDYAYDFGAVAPFFSGDPSDRSAWSAQIARTQAHARRPGELTAVLRAQQQHRGAPPAAVASAERLADPRTVAIVTGQQAGLFGGPLYTLLKAITALKLAQQVSRDHGVDAVAVFWIEAEDHDWDEVRSCTVLDESLTPRTIALPTRSADPVPVATIQFDDSLERAIAELESVLPPTEFRQSVIDDLRDSYASGRGVADAFGRWLERTLGDRGLVVYDASDPASKPLASPVFTHELSTSGRTASLAASAGSDLVGRGYHSQVQSHDEGPALFRLDGGRRAIRRQNGQFVIGDDNYATATLVQEATDRPASFSPNVLLRPIVQDTIFPTVCYVAGPNELAYLGQLRGVYEHFGVPMPIMYPRATATLVDSAAIRFLTKYELPLDALQPQDEAALNTLLAAQIPAAIDDAFQNLDRSIDEGVARLAAALTTLDPTLEGAARSTLSRMQHDVQTLRGKMIQAAKRRDETLRRQFMRVRALAFPGGHAQERTVGFVWFLNQYGPALVDRLYDELPAELGRHWVIAI